MSDNEIVPLADLAQQIGINTDDALDYIKSLGIEPLPRILPNQSEVTLSVTHEEANEAIKLWVDQWVEHKRNLDYLANTDHVNVLMQGVKNWNRWRMENPDVRPDLRGIWITGADFSRVNFSHANLQNVNLYQGHYVDADFSAADLTYAGLGDATLGNAKFIGTNLQNANLMKAHLYGADFTSADLRGAKLYGANLQEANLGELVLAGQWLESANLKEANLSGSDLSNANLRGANLHGANLSNATLCGADLQGAQLIGANIDGVNLDHALVYGTATWGLEGTPKSQQGLVISSATEGQLTIDDLEVAQFIHLLLRREKIRNIINTVTTKTVLILGRFTHERKLILEAIADELRNNQLVPVIFDFGGLVTRDLTETIKILAGMSLFVIADVSSPKSIPLELQAIIPDHHIPVVPIIEKGEDPFSMLDDFKQYHWVLPLLQYPSLATLRSVFGKAVVKPALAKHYELQQQKSKKMSIRSAESYLDNDL